MSLENSKQLKPETGKTELRDSILTELQTIISTLNRPDFDLSDLSNIETSSKLSNLVLENIRLKFQLDINSDELKNARKEIDELKNKIITEGIKID